jgi:hypothetical protein
MKKLLVAFLILISSVAYSQSGVGYLNYTVYNINPNGAGAYAYNANDFVNMFDTTKGATVYARGTALCNRALLDFNGRWTASGLPNGGNYTGIKITGWFIPKETGTYRFFINGDDAVDFSLDGKVVTSFYGPHGFGADVVGTVSLVAGKSYAFMARYQNWGGGWGMDLEWMRPSQYNWAIQSDEVTSIAPVTSTPTKKAITNFNFNTNLDATKFSLGSALSSTGTLDITNLLDSNKVNTGYKAAITPGQVEWSYTNPNASWLGSGKSRLLIDMRQVGSIDPTKINSVKIFDAYDGNMTYTSHDANGWAIYTVPSSLTKITDGTSANNSSIRNVNSWNTDYAFQSTIAFSQTQAYKTQSISVSTTNNLTTLYNSIVTVSDVYLAFKELANNGLFGNQSGNEFVYGIQYKNADVNDDGYFNEADCFALLQHLTGAKSLVDTFKLSKTLRIIPQLKYDSIGKSNWNTFTTPLDSIYSFDINTGKSIDTLNLATAWKGDINLSHSTTPKSNNLTTMSVKGMSINNQINASIITEMVGDSIYAYITLDPLGQNLIGAQFQLNYDNSILKYNRVKFITKGSPTNWSTDNGGFVGLGSLTTDGSSALDNTTQYIISFTAKQKLSNILGLISIGATDAVNKAGTQLKVKIN